MAVTTPDDRRRWRPLRLDPTTRTLVQVAAVLVVVGALKLTASVTLPLAFALFVIAIFWPMYAALERRIPRALAAVAVLLAFLAFLGAIGGALWYSADQLAADADQHAEAWRRTTAQARAWLRSRGLPAPSGGGSTMEGVAQQLQGALTAMFDAIGGFVLVIAFVVLGLLEVHDFRAKITGNGDGPSHFKRVIERVATDFQRYFLVRTFIGLVTGAGVALGAWAIGLEHALLWGLANFLLNYIPTLGSIIGVVPPTLFALVQFGRFDMAFATAAVVGGVQLVMGAYVDPLVQGSYLRLSALVVLLSVAFWGFVWGVPGAFIGVPLTIVIVLATSQFERTRWIAVLLAERDAAPEPMSPAEQAGGEPEGAPEPAG